MSDVCNVVAERVALGEPLGEHAEHAASCAKCQRIVALSAALASAHHGEAENDNVVDPGPGFTARMTMGAQHRLVERRRNRVIATVSIAAATAALIVLVATRIADRPAPTVAENPITEPTPALDTSGDTVTLDAQDLAFLVSHSDTKRSARLSADWKRINKPLGRYARLLKGIK